MEYKLSKEKLQNDLLYDVLVALHEVMTDLHLDVYVVGALARDIAMEILNVPASSRRTSDLDIAVALKDWEQFERFKKQLLLHHFEKGEPKQRFFYKGETGLNDYELDIVPFGPLATDEKIAWPPEGNPEMSVKCFQDVMRVADTVRIDEQIIVKIAPLAGQFLIKFDTWLDRHAMTDKDANDMFYIMDNYYLANAFSGKPIPSELDLDGDFDLLKVEGEWIACEMRAILSSEHISYYISKLTEQLQLKENSPVVFAMNKKKSDDNYLPIRRALLAMVDILRAKK